MHTNTQSQQQNLSKEASLQALSYLIKLVKNRLGDNGVNNYASAYGSTLKKFKDCNLNLAQEQEAKNSSNQNQYLPLLGLNSYIYISAQVPGVQSALDKGKTPVTKLSVGVVQQYDPNGNKDVGNAVNKQQVSLTYENLATWGEPDASLMQEALINGGLKLPDPQQNPQTHLWSLVACVAEPSRHIEWAIMACMANELATAKCKTWAKRIEDHHWPPMVSSANFSMVKLKKGDVSGTENFQESWSSLASEWLSFHKVSIEVKENVEKAIKDAVDGYFILLNKRVALIEDKTPGLIKNPPKWEPKTN